MSQPGERTVVAPGPPPAPAPRSLARASLARALGIVDAGPRLVGRAALVSLMATCIVGIAVTRFVRPAGSLNEPQKMLVFIGLAGLLVAGLLALLTVITPARTRAAVLDRVVAPEQRAAIWLALTAWFPFLLIVAYYRVKATLPPTQAWIAFGFMDKRWVTAAYLLGALAPALLVVAAARVLEAGRAHPHSWHSWLRDLGPGRKAAPAAQDAAAGALAAAGSVPATGSVLAGGSVPPAGSVPAAGTVPDAEAGQAAAASTAAETGPGGEARLAAGRAPGVRGAGFIRVTAGLLTALGLAYYFYGPPWFLNRTFGSAAIGAQEDVFLGGFQAISKGAVPYIGPASVQYGPGAQLLSYWFMRHLATFSVVGFRESWATFQWVGASIFFVVLFLGLGYVRGLLAALMSALIYPALQLMGFAPDGAYAGFYGWANPLRYVGAFSLILLLPAVIRRAPARRGLAGAAVLGLLWGVLSYVAQENLVAGAIGAVVIAALLLFSGSASWRAVLTSLLAVAAGFIVSWLPVLTYYAAKGLLGRFLYLYFYIAKAVADGYSNTPFGGLNPAPTQVAQSAPWANVYYILPFILAALALLAVVQFRPFRIARDWSKERILLFAVLLATILIYQGALLRADSDHLTGTLLVLPVLVIAVATVLPRLMGARRQVTLVLAGAAVLVASFVWLPSHIYNWSNISAQAQAPMLDREHLAGRRAPAPPPTTAARRVGAGVWARSACCQRYFERMSEFIKLANQIHRIVGTRTTYVVSLPYKTGVKYGSAGPGSPAMAGYPGLLYFIADLRPAPFSVDKTTMVLTAAQEKAYMADFRRNVLPHTQAIVTWYLGAAEAKAFRERYPHAKRFVLHYRNLPYWVLLS